MLPQPGDCQVGVSGVRCQVGAITILTFSGSDLAAIQAVNEVKEEIVVIGQDERDVGVTDSSQWWEEERAVEELLVHPDCNPGQSHLYSLL